MNETIEPVGQFIVGDTDILIRVQGEPGFETDEIIGRYTGYLFGRLGGRDVPGPQYTLQVDDGNYQRGVITKRKYNKYALYILDQAGKLGDFAKHDLPRLGETGELIGGVDFLGESDSARWVRGPSTMRRIFGFDRPYDPEEAEKVLSLVTQALYHTRKHYNITI